MTGSLEDRPVALSRSQWESASEKGEAFSVYVVEHAGDDARTRIVRIPNPAGLAKYFTLDRGWLRVARYREDR